MLLRLITTLRACLEHINPRCQFSLLRKQDPKCIRNAFYKVTAMKWVLICKTQARGRIGSCRDGNIVAMKS